MSAEVVETALAMSSADEAIVIATVSSSTNLRWANSTLTTNGSTREHSVIVVSILGRSFGVRAGTSIDRASLEELVRNSEADARNAGDAEDFGHLVEGTPDATFDQDADHTSPTVFSDFANDLGKAFDATASADISLFGFAKHDMATAWLGTSSGIRKRHSQPSGMIEWTAKNKNPRGSAWFGQATRDFTDIAVDSAIEELSKRLSWTDNSIDLPAGRYETILPPTAVADLMIYAYWSASGRDAAEGRNAYSKAGGGTRAGERLAESTLHLRSDPHDRELACLPFAVAGSSSSMSSVFDNGLPLHATNWIKGGVLDSFIETRKSASSRGLVTTPAIDNLILDTSGTKSLNQMIATTERGLLVTCLWYIREIDPRRLLLTGLTRDGVYLVEDGEVKGAVNNFRWNESPLELLGRISEAGRSVRTLPREWNDYFQNTRMPALRIPDFNMSTVSPAN